jgi:predicted amidophosphoribosyltransferase
MAVMAWRGLIGVVREAGALVLPDDCAGCGAPGGVLCPDCLTVWDGPVRRVEAGAPRLCPADGGPALPCWAVASYEGAARTAVASWKRAGRSALTRPFGRTMARLGRAVAAPLRLAARAAGAGACGGGSAGASAVGAAGASGRGARASGTVPADGPGAAASGSTGDGEIWVVPVPSRAWARFRRGPAPAARLARAVASGLRAGGAPARVRPALARTAGSRDQVGQGSRARAAGRDGTTRVKARWAARATGRTVLLVDDVVTTGASLLDAERALAAAGALVMGAAVLAATPA